MRSSNRFLPACVLAVAMALSPTAKSQGVVVEQTSQKAVEKSLIKEIPTQYPKTMSSFNNEDGTVAFVLSDANLNTSEVELEGYWVNDMVVTKDSVFFCGVTTGENVVGIVGSFEIATFFAGTSGVNLWSNFLSGDKNYPVLELTRMVSYRNTYGERHAVCVGKVSDGYSCIVDMPIDATPGSIPGYMSGYINKANETLTDISTVHYRDSYYLVTGGFETTSGRSICLRLYDYDNVLYSGLQDVRYVFKIDTS